MSNYDLNRHKQGDKIKWIISGVAMVLAFVMIIGLFLQVFGQGKVKPSEWFNHEETKQTSPDTENEDTELSAGGATLSEGESNGMLLSATAIPLNAYEEYGVSALAENAYNLNVTYTPADTTFQETTYSIAFKNPSSTWATGKTVTDYATVTQSAVGSKDAVLTVLQPFSEQIIVTATCNRNTAIKATTTVDYVCKSLSIDVDNVDLDVDCDTDITFYGWSNGTLTPETSGTITFVFDVGEYFVSQALAAGFEVDRFYSHLLIDDESDLLNGVGILSIKEIYHNIADYSSMSVENKKAYDLFLGRQFGSYSDKDSCGRYSFSYKRIYNGVDYGGFDTLTDLNNSSGEWWYDYDRGINFSEAFEIVATSVMSNTSSIIAG